MSTAQIRRNVMLVALAAAVALAFADSSIVVLALPDLLARYRTSIQDVSWVITAYNVAVAVVSLALVWGVRRVPPAVLARVGLVVFLGGSIASGAAWGVWPLVGFRVVQGVGAALLLAASLPLLRALAPARGTSIWTGAGLVGAAIGPAAGGLLTQFLDWRSIFYAQAPIAAVALLAVRTPVLTATEPPAVTERVPKRAAVAANAALALLSAALVGLLFLAVVLLIDVWGLEPAAAAGVVSALPLATVLAQAAGRRLAPFAAAASGVLLVVAGLLGLALLPTRSLAVAAIALALAGAGLGLVVGRLTPVALAAGGSSFTAFLRHAGLVLGLVVLTPVLTADLTAATDQTKLRSTAVVLDAPLPASTKLKLAIELAPTLTNPARGKLPEFGRLLQNRPPPIRALGERLDGVVQDGVARAFRNSFLIAALFALAALVPLAFALPRTRRLRAPAVALVALLAFAGGELAGGALAYGHQPKILPPCAARTTTEAPGVAQRFALRALDELACRLGKSREQLVIDAAAAGVDAADFFDRVRNAIAQGIEKLKQLFGG